MTLDEIRVQIDAIDTEMKALFLKRMECAKRVAETKAETGGDVFVPAREQAMVEKRAFDVEVVRDEYEAFLRHLISLSRRYQYGILTGMQDRVIEEELKKAGLEAAENHSQIEIALTCSREASELNLYINMIKLNGIILNQLNLITEGNRQKIVILLEGSLKEENMRRLLCQLAKEADDFAVTALKER